MRERILEAMSCWRKYYIIRKAARRVESQSRIRTCLQCGDQFTDKENTHNKMCSPICRKIARSTKQGNRLFSEVKFKIKYKSCKFCGGNFFAKNDRFEYCSKLCVHRNDNLRHPPSLDSLEKQKAKTKTPEFKKRRVEQLKKRISVDPCFKLRGLVSKNVARALKKLKSSKRDSVLIYLPYSIPKLKAHLESQFNNVNGFTWENHGSVWHIDHIIPQSVFPYTDLDSKNFRDCWALSNLRPLERIENIKKSAKILMKR